MDPKLDVGESGKKGKISTQEQVAMQQCEPVQGSSKSLETQPVQGDENKLGAPVGKDDSGSQGREGAKSVAKPASLAKPKKRKRLPFTGVGTKRIRKRKPAANRYVNRKKPVSSATLPLPEKAKVVIEAAGKEAEPKSEVAIEGQSKKPGDSTSTEESDEDDRKDWKLVLPLRSYTKHVSNVETENNASSSTAVSAPSVRPSNEGGAQSVENIGEAVEVVLQVENPPEEPPAAVEAAPESRNGNLRRQNSKEVSWALTSFLPFLY